MLLSYMLFPIPWSSNGSGLDGDRGTIHGIHPVQNFTKLLLKSIYNVQTWL